MSGSGIHPIIRTSLSSAFRGIAPMLINSIANKIAGNGRRKRTYKKRTGGAIIHRPLLRIGVGACRKRKSGTGKRRCVLRARPKSAGAWQLSTTRGGGSRKRRVGRPCVRRSRAIRV